MMEPTVTTLAEAPVPGMAESTKDSRPIQIRAAHHGIVKMDLVHSTAAITLVHLIAATRLVHGIVETP